MSQSVKVKGRRPPRAAAETADTTESFHQLKTRQIMYKTFRTWILMGVVGLGGMLAFGEGTAQAGHHGHRGHNNGHHAKRYNRGGYHRFNYGPNRFNYGVRRFGYGGYYGGYGRGMVPFGTYRNFGFGGFNTNNWFGGYPGYYGLPRYW
jgi:hypothetical protein